MTITILGKAIPLYGLLFFTGIGIAAAIAGIFLIKRRNRFPPLKPHLPKEEKNTFLHYFLLGLDCSPNPTNRTPLRLE